MDGNRRKDAQAKGVLVSGLYSLGQLVTVELCIGDELTMFALMLILDPHIGC